MMMGMLPTSVAVAAAGNTMTLDGNSGSVNSSAASFTVSVTTALPNSLIILGFISNAGLLASGTPPTATGPTSLTFTAGSNGVQNGIGYWYARTTTAGAFTITVTPNTAQFTTVNAFGISNVPAGALFDGSVMTGTTDPQPITTTNPTDFVFAIYKTATVSSPTAGSGWNLLSGANFGCFEYKLTTSAGPQSATMTTGAGDANAGLVHAVMQGP